MSASGRYLEYIEVNSENVIVEVRILESKVEICGKQVTTNKWLLPRQWQEIHSILHSAAEYYMNNKDRRTLVASGKDTQVALVFKPYLAVYQDVMKPYSVNGSVEEALEDSGNDWIKSEPYESVIIASVAPKQNSDICSAVENGSSSESCQNPWCGPTEKMSYSEITWKTLDNVEIKMSSYKLEDGYRSPEHASEIPEDFNHPFDMCCTQDIAEVKYSRYTGEASWVTVDSGSTEVSFKDVDHKHNFKSESSQSGDVSSNASNSEESFKLIPKKIRKLSKKHNVTKSETSDSPKSKKNGRTKYISSSSGTFLTKEHEQRNIQEKINRFLSPLEKKKAKTRIKVETDLESHHSSSDQGITKKKASGIENPSETVSVKWNLRRNRTDEIMSSFSLNSEGKVRKCTGCETISLKCDKSSKDFKLETKKRKLQRKVSTKNECGNGSTITQFFPKKSLTFSPSCNPQTSVKILKESTSEMSNSDDECVPDTPKREPNFHIIQTTEKKECLMKDSRSVENTLIVQKSTSLSQIINLNYGKNCNKTEEGQQTKQKRSKLSSRKKGSESVNDMDKDKLSTNIHQSSGSAQTKKSAISKNLRSSKGNISVSTSANERLQSENPKFERSVSDTSLLQLKRNEHSTNTRNRSASREKKEDKSMLPNASFCSRNSESPLKSKTVEISQMEEGSTSSNSAVQDITATHLTLEQLEKRFDENVEYLRAIMKGKEYCWRQVQFKKCGRDSMNLKFALSTVPYTDEQIHHLLSLLRKNFCKENNFVKLYDYLMKVLLPEATTKILMDEFSLTHNEVLEKIHNTYIVARKRMPFPVSDNEDDYDST